MYLCPACQSFIWLLFGFTAIVRMNHPAAELRGIWNTEYSSQKSEFFEDILIPLLDSYPEADLRGILLNKNRPYPLRSKLSAAAVQAFCS